MLFSIINIYRILLVSIRLYTPKKHKYNNVKTALDGHIFASKREASRYAQLKLLQSAGEIRNLQLQPVFTFTMAGLEVRHKNYKQPLKYVDCKRALKYIADFSYEWLDRTQQHKGWQIVIEDSKGFKTPEYKIKRALMLYFYGIEVKEV